MNSHRMPNQPTTNKTQSRSDDERLWALVGTGNYDKFCELYWEIMRERDERAKQYRRGRFKTD